MTGIKQWIMNNLEPSRTYSSNPISSRAFAERVTKDTGVTVSPEDFTVAMLEMGYTMKEPDGHHRTYPIFMCKATPTYKHRMTKSSRYNRWYVNTEKSC
jgi:hypothetical protein